MKNIFRGGLIAPNTDSTCSSYARGGTLRNRGRSSVRLLIAMFSVFLAIASGVFFYTKFAQAATFNFVQSSWTGGADLINPGTHYLNQTNWTKYASSTGLVMGNTVQLTAAPFTFTDDDATSTSASFTITGGSFLAGTNSNTVTAGDGRVILGVQQ